MLAYVALVDDPSKNLGDLLVKRSPQEREPHSVRRRPFYGCDVDADVPVTQNSLAGSEPLVPVPVVLGDLVGVT